MESYAERRYDREFPDITEGHRFYKAIKAHERALFGDAFRAGRLRVLRRSKAYRDDIRRTRAIVGIPPEGYGRREASKKLSPYARAFVDCLQGKRGSYKRRGEAGRWAVLVLFVEMFAREHPLGNRRPMPVIVAFEEIVYRGPRPEFVLRGFFHGTDKPVVLLEDAVTKAPEAIARMVRYRIRGDDNEVVRRIRIFNRVRDSGEWAINQNS